MSLRALAADPSLGETFLSIGMLRMVQGDIRAGAHAFQEALARAPRLVQAHSGLGVVLVDTGRIAEGMRRLDLALRTDPLSFGALVERARAKALLGDRPGAEEDLRQAAAIGGVLGTYALVVRLVIWWNDREGAARLADALAQAKTGAGWDAAVPLLRALSRGEYFHGAPELFASLDADGRASLRMLCTRIEIASEYFALMGKHEEAFEWLHQAESVPFMAVTWLDRCPALDALRGDPRFARVRALAAARAAEVWR
jgi:serine/threonine-protein kinase